MNWYWIMAILYTICNTTAYIKDREQKKEEIDIFYMFFLIILSLLFAPIVLVIDIWGEMQR